MKTLNVSLLLVVVISLVSTGVVSAAANGDSKSVAAAEGQIGKNIPMEPAAIITITLAIEYAILAIALPLMYSVMYVPELTVLFLKVTNRNNDL
ncbi:MAG: hypothetical protein OIN66_03260 [Candidatus Methanoperedens sp.]|nr:hypothetical protein [Candidatus Methanoperedens sp.]